MRRIRITIIAMVIAILFVNAICACSVQNCALADASTSVQSGGKNNMKLLIDNVEVPVEWEDNESIKQILNIASSSDIIVNAHRYGGLEGPNDAKEDKALLKKAYDMGNKIK